MLRFSLLGLLAAAFLTTALQCAGSSPSGTAAPTDDHAPTRPAASARPLANADTAVFAMGCFWCAETAFEGADGIGDVISGFTGGTLPNPTYEQVGRGGTGHYEAIQVPFDTTQIDYATLLRIFWHNVDPFDAGGQFCDRGDVYRAAIFPRTAAQRQLAEASKATVEGRFDEPLATEILPAAPFYRAEEYHQDFYRKDPERYHSYRLGCRRDARLRDVWGDDALRAGDA
ncbi:MAG TPA: peptide-methionine (S)-S-oxide reductase MsrA, partial [Rubricoccaceae bacterium]|nr:peptide-methionine (S)-S-oxide reductase MsrA [Rubricoccaceae bacterium]